MNASPLYYTNGKKYRPAHGYAFTGQADLLESPCLLAGLTNVSWEQFWYRLQKELKNRGYNKSSILLYRQVLRKLRESGVETPCKVTRARIKNYITEMSYSSWSWIGTNISVLRNAFDKLGGLEATTGLKTPKRGWRLPVILSQGEIDEILEAAPTVRDQLLLGLMYGCGLKVSEVCSLRWENVDLDHKVLKVKSSCRTKHRELPIPIGLMAVLTRGVSECPADNYIFQGRKPETHLSTRMAELILRKALKKVNIPKIISCMTLRHSYAVHQLENKLTIREVQEQLGHKSVETTMRYEKCILPKLTTNPLTIIRGMINNSEPERQEVKAIESPISPLCIPKASSLDGLELPFKNDEADSILTRAMDFYNVIKIKLSEKFLS